MTDDRKSTVSRQQPLVPGDELVRKTTTRLTRSLEWIALLFQAATLAAATLAEEPQAIGQWVVYGLAGVHLIAAIVVYFVPGPITRGGPWVALWLGLAVLMPLIVGNVYRPGQYARFVGGVQLGAYSMAPLAVLGFYPWQSSRLARYRIRIELTLLLAIILGPLLVVLRLYNGALEQNQLTSIAMSAGWSIVTFFAGKSFAKLFAEAAQLQLDVRQQTYGELFDFLHSRVDGALAVLRGSTDHAQVTRQLEELKHDVDKVREEMLLLRDPIPLPEVFQAAIRLYSPAVCFVETPQIGTFSVQRQVGVLIHRALGDLLKNAAQYGATEVSVRFWRHADTAFLAVIDNGPGFDGALLNDSSTSLHGLRQDARRLGGDLIKSLGGDTDMGSHMRLSVPLHPVKA